MISYRTALTNSGASLSGRKGVRSPYTRMRGGSPAMKCRSEPRFSRISLRYASICATLALSVGLAGRGRRRGAIHLRQHAGVGDELLEVALLGGVVVGVVG